MGKTFILGSNTATSWANGLGKLVTVPTFAINDYEKIHDFVCQEFTATDDTDKVVVDLDAVNPALALLIALHIRLSVADIKTGSLVPLLFVSKLPLQSFLKYGECSQLFLMPRGTYFCMPEETSDAMEIIEGLSVDNFKSDFLSQIHISPDSEIGRHSMANQWGADVFNRIISKDDRKETDEIASAKKKLYYKYVFLNTIDIEALISNNAKDLVRENVRLNAIGKNILLIDDEADKGWSFVLKDKFLLNSNFDVISNTIANYNEIPETIRKKIESDFYDLYLLDLRLLGTKEDEIYSADDFSGMKVLKEIKRINNGNQVIILTASNKAWNMKALLDAGADGYYIKESPELKLPMSFSNANFQSFKHDVAVAFDNSFKKKVVRKLSSLIATINSSDRLKQYNDLSLELVNALNNSLRQIVAAKSKNDFAFSYIALFQIFEILSREFVCEVENGDWNLDLYNIDNRTGAIMDAISRTDTPHPPILSKLVAIYKTKQVVHSNSFVLKLNEVIKMRHAFVHNLKELSNSKNQKIFSKEGFILLLDAVDKIINSII